ncbi:aminotransferase class V-fold PLP-dependent enzyme [Sphingomonas sp.]|uniref:aminotransferase class V-fold PLP-dependent enzyme n=1 Tax=Sphingomonas sp. TaxID=28214 RepID=UPI001EBA1E9A|nr:aminotransferase class V-fold PLP-dependent enzyme [Sphingomonas sp.]MBX3595600.1 aminotransferase class V-fold PLP-dependent enzyme [Sphingomonas sp.]
MTSYKHLFQRSLAAAPDRLHFAAHSHHLWPDASWIGHQAAWDDAARLADRKWDRVMGEIWPAAQRHVAAELHLPDPASIVFAGNTHDLIVRLVSARAERPLRVLASSGEFHSFRRQAQRWIESGRITLDAVPTGPDFDARFIEAARRGDHDLIFVSQVMFETGAVFTGLAELAALARPDGPWVVIDGYHGFMAIESDLSAVADRVFYTAGGYKYAMAGEGVAFLHCPPGFGPRPEFTGWYAEFEGLEAPPGRIGYADDARRFMGSTFDPSGLYRFVAVRDMLADTGLSTGAINAHVAPLRARLIAALDETELAGATLLNPGGAPHARFLALRSPDAPAWKSRLMAQDIVTDVRGDVLRIGIGLYHDPRDVERLRLALGNRGDA